MSINKKEKGMLLTHITVTNQNHAILVCWLRQADGPSATRYDRRLAPTAAVLRAMARAIVRPSKPRPWPHRFTVLL